MESSHVSEVIPTSKFTEILWWPRLLVERRSTSCSSLFMLSAHVNSQSRCDHVHWKSGNTFIHVHPRPGPLWPTRMWPPRMCCGVRVHWWPTTIGVWRVFPHSAEPRRPLWSYPSLYGMPFHIFWCLHNPVLIHSVRSCIILVYKYSLFLHMETLRTYGPLWLLL